jgi:hypothetical protein
MRYTVPQFIEHEAKIIGPLTFKQFVYLAIAGAGCFVVYFMAPFSVFLISCVVLGLGAVAFAFLKIGGRSLPTMIGNFLTYSLTPKMYIWRKKEQVITIYKKEKKPSSAKATENEEELPLKIAGKSQLKKLHTKIETK